MEHSGDLESWQRPECLPDLVRCLSHINIGSTHKGGDEVSRARSLFDALNTLWTCHARLAGSPSESDNAAFRDLFFSIPQRRVEVLLDSERVSTFATFAPHILDHDVLRRSPYYRPDTKLPRELLKNAAAAHGQLERAHARWVQARTAECLTALCKKLAQLLYIVRSNIAHGEKTPFGPDLQKVERDRVVCEVTNPVLEALLDALLDHPGCTFAVYGTLAPGEANEEVLRDLTGEWIEGVVSGTIRIRANLKVFRWLSGSSQVRVKVLHSHLLPSRWQALDQFEGMAYHRILVPVQKLDGSMLVANIYEGAQQRHGAGAQVRTYWF